MKKDFMAVILGSDDNVYGFARTFHKKYNIKPVALCGRILEPSKASNIISFIIDENIHDQKHFEDLLVNLGNKLKEEYKKIILIPCSDSYIEMVSKAKDKLTMYENEFIDLDTLKTFNDKVSFYNMCEKYDLPYPKSYIVNPNNYMEVINNATLDYPLILKPNNSNSEDYLDASFDGKEKVYYINSKEELLSKISIVYNSTYKDDLIIQKFVKGKDINNRVLNVYSDKQGKVKMMSLGMPILEEYHPNTYGNYAAIISLTEHIEIMDKIKSFLEAIKYVGASNFDIKIDEISKNYYLFEINPRPGRSSLFSEFAGCGFPTSYVEDLVYNRLEEHLNNDKEILWLNVPMDLIDMYVKDDKVNEKINELTQNGEVYHTLHYENDMSDDRKEVLRVHYERKLNYFPKYYKEK